MAHGYDHKSIEAKWQKRWESENVFSVSNNSLPSALHPNGAGHLPSGRGGHTYVLDMFPYPSGDGLHVGHPEGYTATDIYSRYLRMNGRTVLHPMGWDAFGLPAENYAIKMGVHPAEVTNKNIANFKRQIQSLGFSYDWTREVKTTDPAYYKWTQWIFLQLFKRGLAYEKESAIWWCPKDKTGLANEEVVNGKCDRCGTVVEKKMLKQWMLKITAYADRLLDGLDTLDWPESIKALQRNWIGKSDGAEVNFAIEDHVVTVFTTRPDTLFGATYLVLSPEHELVPQITTDKQKKAVEKYVKSVAAKSDLERTSLEKEKTGVFTGAYAVNPVNNEKIPVWIADYVLSGYGTGAIMAVPAHDERDFAFATKFGLPVVEVVTPPTPPLNQWGGKETPLQKNGGVWIGEGTMLNSGKFDGLPSAEARQQIVSTLQSKAQAQPKTQYKLRDWVFSRQRYWGEPIPLIHCAKCGVVPVPEDQLPLKLPDVEKYEPTGTGESPLAGITDWVNTTCPQCGGPAKRETNTMPQWAGSCWYYLRFCDPMNDKEFASADAMKAWLPVDMYVGGAEHAVLHLLYARFWHKALFDAGFIPPEVGDEPFKKLKNQGLILGPDGEKMSKSRGNVINPDELIEKFGADTFRMYEMFMGPFEDAKPWDTNGMIGVRRFLDRVYKIVSSLAVSELENKQSSRHIHRAVQRISDGIANFKLNTAVSNLMIFFDGVDTKPDWRPKLNSKGEFDGTTFDRGAMEKFLKLLSPFAPHITEELWSQLRHETMLVQEPWPKYDESKVTETTVTIAVQVMGKLRATMTMPAGSDEATAVAAAKVESNVAKFLTSEPKKVIFVKDKLINFVV